jgi:hypothetical protein
LWIIDAISMNKVVAKIKLPQRVPYGLHGCWFGEEDVQSQRPYAAVRTLSATNDANGGLMGGLRDMLEKWID